MLRFALALLVAAALAALYFFVALKWSYSTGDRAGWVQKLSEKGWICKTWEGEMAMMSMPGAPVEKFFFTIRDEAVAEQVMKRMGKRVSLHYEEKVGLPTTCFGDTRHFITKVEVELETTPGVGGVPAGAAPAAMPAPAPVLPTPASAASAR